MPKLAQNGSNAVQAMEDDGVDYLGPVGDRWGELCGSRNCQSVAGGVDADTVMLNRPEIPATIFTAQRPACLVCWWRALPGVARSAGMDRKPFWHYRRYGVEALLAMGRKSEALKYAEASRGLNQPDSTIDQACERSRSPGLHDRGLSSRYGLRAAQWQLVSARFRAVAKRYPMIAPEDILSDLIKTTPGKREVVLRQPGLKLYEFAAAR